MVYKKSIEQPGGIRDVKEDNDKKTTKPDNKQDNVFFKPYKGEEQKKQISPALKRAHEEENIKNIRQNLFDLAALLDSGRVRIEVMVSGEKQSLQIEQVFNNGRYENPEDIMGDITDINLNNLEAKFKLQWIAGRDEKLEIDCKLPIKQILKGEGKLEDLLNKNITEIFAGTAVHYKNIKKTQKEQQEQKQEKLSEPQYKEEKQKIINSLEGTGASITTLEGKKKLTIIANYPNKDGQIIISLINRQTPWHIDYVKKQKVERSVTTNQPSEILPELYNWIENQ